MAEAEAVAAVAAVVGAIDQRNPRVHVYSRARERPCVTMGHNPETFVRINTKFSILANDVCRTIAASMLAMLFVVGLAGCQSHSGPATAKAKQDPSKISAEEAKKLDAFEAGAGKPPSPATLYTLARILIAKGDTVQAVATLRNLLQRYPSYAPAYNALAEAYLSSDRTDDALAALKAGVARAPKDPVLLNNLGMVYFMQGDYDSALTNFDRAVAIAPGEPQYTSNKAAALGMLGRVVEAADLYRKHLRKADVNENIGVLVRARSAAGAMNTPAAQHDTDVLEATGATTQPSASIGQATAEPRATATAVVR